MSDNHSSIVTVPVREFMRRSGISRSQTYVLLDEGLLESAKVRGTRLIFWSSYERLLERNRVPARRHAPLTNHNRARTIQRSIGGRPEER